MEEKQNRVILVSEELNSVETEFYRFWFNFFYQVSEELNSVETQ